MDMDIKFKVNLISMVSAGQYYPELINTVDKTAKDQINKMPRGFPCLFTVTFARLSRRCVHNTTPAPFSH